MDPKDLFDIKKNMIKLTESVEGLEKTVNSLKLNQQGFVKGNNPIPPGISPKIAYDSKGLILRGMELEIDDLPELPIDKIVGLRRALSRLEEPIDRASDKPLKKSYRKIDPGTGVKVNWNDQGQIVSFSDLLVKDIPELPVDKITGLVERLKLLEERDNSPQPIDSFVGNAGSGSKLFWDNQGRILRSEPLTMNDLPRELSEQLIEVQGCLSSFASNEIVKRLQLEVSKRIEALDTPPRAGTFTKLTINSDGLVLSGEPLTLKDLPPLGINDILELETALRNRVTRKEFVELQNSFSSLLNYNPTTELQAMKNRLQSKVEETELTKVINEINSLRSVVEGLSARLPHESYQTELRELTDSVSTLQDKVVSMEKNVLSGQFCTIPKGVEGE